LYEFLSLAHEPCLQFLENELRAPRFPVNSLVVMGGIPFCFDLFVKQERLHCLNRFSTPSGGGSE
jgi:hypothetical protein